MSIYSLQWVTNRLAVGSAPMSRADLETVKDQGIDAILNLCEEYHDLVEVEQQSGFEVFYFPVPDDAIPALPEMERALDWLDEAIYLGKRVLVHCRWGLGRTGTLITSYLLRRGFGLKLAREQLQPVRSCPSSFYQWRLLRQYEKQEGRLTIREPSVESRTVLDLSPYFSEYESTLAVVAELRALTQGSHRILDCGADTDGCCRDYLHLTLIEAAYLAHNLNRRLSREDRQEVIARAVTQHRRWSPDRERKGPAEMLFSASVPPPDASQLQESPYRCPLWLEGRCIALAYRPLACRVFGLPRTATGRFELPPQAHFDPWRDITLESLHLPLQDISRRLFLALNANAPAPEDLVFPLTHVVSGKFIQDYFRFLAAM